MLRNDFSVKYRSKKRRHKIPKLHDLASNKCSTIDGLFL